MLTTQSGNNLTVTVKNGDWYINNAKIIAADQITSNGVAHVVDSVCVLDSCVDLLQLRLLTNTRSVDFYLYDTERTRVYRCSVEQQRKSRDRDVSCMCATGMASLELRRINQCWMELIMYLLRSTLTYSRESCT